MRFSLSISVVLRISGILLDFGSGPLVLFANVVELLHVLKEVFAAAERDEQFGLFAIAAVVGSRDRDGFGADLFESGVLVANQVLSGNNAGGDSVAKSVKFDLFVTFKVFLAQENIEVWRLLNRNVNLVRVLVASAGGALGGDLLRIRVFHHCSVSFL